MWKEQEPWEHMAISLQSMQYGHIQIHICKLKTEKIHVIQIAFYIRPKKLKRKRVKKRWEVQSCLWDYLSNKHSTKGRFLNEKMNRLVYLNTYDITQKF